MTAAKLAAIMLARLSKVKVADVGVLPLGQPTVLRNMKVNSHRKVWYVSDYKC